RSVVGHRMRLGVAVRRVAGGRRRPCMDEADRPRPRSVGLCKTASVGTGWTPVSDRGLLDGTPIQLPRTLNFLVCGARSDVRRSLLSIRKSLYWRPPISPPRRVGSRDVGKRSLRAQRCKDAAEHAITILILLGNVDDSVRDCFNRDTKPIAGVRCFM